MGNFSSEFKVGLFTVIAGVVLAFFLLNTRDAPFGPGRAYTVYTVVPSASGIQFGSIVSMAGVQVGRVGVIELTPEGRARVALELRDEVKLPTDSKATLQTMGILGDKSVHLMPGKAEAVLPAGSTLPYEPGTLEKVTENVDLEELSKQINGLVANLNATSESLKVVAKALEQSMTSGGVTSSLEGIMKNLDAITATMNQVGKSNQGDLNEIVDNIRAVSENLNDVVVATEKLVKGGGEEVESQLGSIREAVQKVNDVLGQVEKVVAGVEAGEGTVGKLLKDPTTAETLNDTLADASELIEKINRFKTHVAYRGDYYLTGTDEVRSGLKNTLAITLAAREDYYYMLELVSDPRLDYTLEVVDVEGPDGEVVRTRRERTFTDAWQFSAQFARRWHDLVLRLGIKENHGGVGADYFLWRDRIVLSADLYDFNGMPNLELRGRLSFYDHLYLTAGTDDLLNRIDAWGQDGSPRLNFFVGGGFTFQDDDLKFLLSYLPL